MANTKQVDVYQRQKEYCATGTTDDLIDGSLFVESMRKLGYRDIARAVDELIDNSIEAKASNFYVFFGFDESGSTKPSTLAFVDDGHGMIPEMVAAACRWGGTDRHGSTSLFGRFGFGLPSASVSQGRSFSLYSRIDGGDFYKVTIDVDLIVKGEYSKDGRVATPTAAPSALPEWLGSRIAAEFPGGLEAVRTVVVWEKLDYKQWRTESDLLRNLLQRFGVTYRGFLRTMSIVVNGKKVEPIDPLFVTPGARYFEPLPDGAEPLPGLAITIRDEDTGESLGDLTVRYAYMPPTFLDASRGRKGDNPAKARFQIRKENNGIIVMRQGRQIDVVSRGLVTFQNNHKYVGVEIDFPATMDDLFGVTTSKQQVTVSERVETILRQHNVHSAINQMYKRYGEEALQLRGKELEGTVDGPRASEKVMEEIGSILLRTPVSQEVAKTAQENLEREIDRVAEETELDRAIVADEKIRQTEARPYKVELERVAEGAFFRAELRGSQLVIFLNTAHRFYQDLYISVEGFEGQRLRSSLELLLFVMGQSEVFGNQETQIWYAGERIDWSRKLQAALTKLDSVIGEVVETTDDDAGNTETATV